MPTAVECGDLVEKCDWTWTTQNGIPGYVVRGKGDFKEASIFLPAAGYGNMYGPQVPEDSPFGNIWSSSSVMGDPKVSLILAFPQGNPNVGADSRNLGLSVRPLREPYE